MTRATARRKTRSQLTCSRKWRAWVSHSPWSIPTWLGWPRRTKSWWDMFLWGKTKAKLLKALPGNWHLTLHLNKRRNWKRMLGSWKQTENLIKQSTRKRFLNIKSKIYCKSNRNFYWERSSRMREVKVKKISQKLRSLRHLAKMTKKENKKFKKIRNILMTVYRHLFKEKNLISLPW